MQYDEIKYQLDQMVKRLLDKKLERPASFLQINSGGMTYANVIFYDEGEYNTKGVWDDEPGRALNELWNFIREIPEAEDRARNRYFKKVSDAVEYGRQMGVDQALINPLLEQMKKLSSNIIEHKPAPATDDDIPF